MYRVSSALLIIAMVFMAGCAAHVHQIGDGPQSHQITTKRQWYAAWGLVPINEVDTNAIADGATDYQIMTAITETDWIVGVALGWATIKKRSSKVISNENYVPYMM